MKSISTRLLASLFVCLISGFFIGCEKWELPGRKTKRECTKPSGSLDAQIQQKKVNFSIAGIAGTIDKITWEFGNGSTTVTTGSTASHTYASAGTYSVKVTLTNTCGDETVLSRTVVVADVTAPTVSLQPASDISTNSVTLIMTMISTGNGSVTSYGICYSSTNPVPEKGDGPTTTVEKDGSLPANTTATFNPTNLQPNTTYYVRSFAVNEKGISYSSPVQTFQTGSKPAVSNMGTSNLGLTTASINFVVMNSGSPAAVEYGICYSSTITTPEVGNSLHIVVATPTVGTNTAVQLKDLNPNTKYYYRAYAKLSSGEIIYSSTTESFTTQIDTLAQDLIALVSFTDGSKQDVSGNNNHVFFVDNPVFVADRKGKANSAVQLDGINDYFYMPENANGSLRPNAISVSVWIKPNAINNVNDRMQIFNKSRWNDSAHEMYSSLVKINETGPGLTFMTNIKQNSNCQVAQSWQSFQFSSNPQLGAWHHLVLTYSGRSIRMYFDNVLVDQDDNLPATTMDNCPGGELKFGAQIKDFPNYFSGAMDDIRIYRRALTASEVQSLYNQ
ncbi:hypothetical protein GCM10027347_26010 [Larkinella harenae]